MSCCEDVSRSEEDLSGIDSPGSSHSEEFHEKQSHPLYIDCVLLNCFKYLSVKTVGNCRLVSKLWNQVACRTLRQRSAVTFRFAEEIYGFMNVMAVCQDLPFQVYILRVFEHEIEHPLVQRFFKLFGPTITSLTFDLQGNSRYAFKSPDSSAFHKLLTRTSVLQELKLFGLPDNILSEGDLFTPSDFPHLKSFSFSIYQDGYGRSTPVEFQRQDENVNFPGQSLIKGRRALIFNILNSVKCPRKLEVGVVNAEVAQEILQEVDLHRLEAFSTLALNTSPLRPQSLAQLGARCSHLTHFSCFLDLNTTPLETYDFLYNMPNLKYLKLQGGTTIKDLPLMTKLQEVHLLIPSTLKIERMIARVPAACVINIMLCSTSSSSLLSDNNNDDESEDAPNSSPTYSAEDNNWVLSDNLVSLQATLRGCTHNDGLCVTHFLKSIKYRFPSLSRLRLPVTSDTLLTIFHYFTNLKELYIEDGSKISDEVVTGISSHYLYDLDSLEVQKDIVCCVSRTRPYIGDLKYLQRLYVGSTSITNASVNYGFSDLHELTSISLVEPLEIVVGQDNERLQIAEHYFSLYPLIRHLPRLVKVEVKESRFRAQRHEHPAILPEEIEHVKRMRPHLQIVYGALLAERGDIQIINY